jgi:hypothetical protein
MIDWWGVFHNALWVGGLAAILAALSMANYQAHAARARLREKLGGPGFQLAFDAGMGLFCLGLLFGSAPWWERGVWGVLAALFAGQAIWLWYGQRRQARTIQAESSPQAGGTMPGRARSGRALGCGLILAGLLVLAGWAVFTGLGVLEHARSLQSHLEQLEGLTQGGIEALPLGELESAGQHLAGMHHDLGAIEAQVGPLLPAGRLLGWVPRYGGDLAAASDLLDLAVATTAAGDRTFQALSPALDLVSGSDAGVDPAASIGERLLPVLVAAQPELQAARQELATVEGARERVDVQSLSPRVSGLLSRLDRYLPWLETAVDGALLAPALLGADGRRTYLVVAQNNQELRATGGFISGVGELAIEDGRLSSLNFDDSYAVDNLEVPHELTPADFQATLFGQLWFFRDANWNADFATSARRALEIYGRDRGLEADGVVALDLTALQWLVDAVGPIHVEGIEEPMTGANVLQAVQSAWSEPAGGSGYEWWLHRKDFMGQIASAAMDRLMTGQGLQPAKLAWALKKVLDEKHILVYLDDPQAAGLLRQRNWDGAVVNPSGFDALLVVDSNVGFNKVDPNVARSVHYRVDLGASGGPQAQVVVTYQNRSRKVVEACIQESRYGDTYVDMMERCYWDYVRVYVPQGSELLAGPELLLPAGSLVARQEEPPPESPVPPVLEEANRRVWTSFFALEPLGERTLTFEYRLPDGILSRGPDGLVHYRLEVQKQAGTEAVPLELEVVLPPGAEWVRNAPADQAGPQGGTLKVSTDLRTDRTFEIVYREGEGEP